MAVLTKCKLQVRATHVSAASMRAGWRHHVRCPAAPIPACCLPQLTRGNACRRRCRALLPQRASKGLCPDWLAWRPGTWCRHSRCCVPPGPAPARHPAWRLERPAAAAAPRKLKRTPPTARKRAEDAANCTPLGVGGWLPPRSRSAGRSGCPNSLLTVQDVIRDKREVIWSRNEGDDPPHALWGVFGLSPGGAIPNREAYLEKLGDN